MNTTVPANLSYGIGSVAGLSTLGKLFIELIPNSGFINTATLVFDDYVISEQAYRQYFPFIFLERPLNVGLK